MSPTLLLSVFLNERPVALYVIWVWVSVGNIFGEKLRRRQRIVTTFLVPMSLNDTWYICAVWRHLGAP